MIPDPRKKKKKKIPSFPMGRTKAAETTYELLVKDSLQVGVVLR